MKPRNPSPAEKGREKSNRWIPKWTKQELVEWFCRTEASNLSTIKALREEISRLLLERDKAVDKWERMKRRVEAVASAKFECELDDLLEWARTGRYKYVKMDEAILRTRINPY